MDDHDHDHGGEGDERRGFTAPTLDCARGEDDADHALVARLYDAVLDDCAACREPLLDRFAADPATTAALVRWVCTVVGETYGDIPDGRVAQDHGPLGTPFRDLALAYAHAWQAEYAAIRARCAGMSPERRRAAAGDAVDTITHLDPFADPPADETVDPRDDILVAEIGTTPHLFLPPPHVDDTPGPPRTG